MSKYTSALQHTGRPYAPSENIPEEAWQEYSRHTSLEAAYKALNYARYDMAKACGGDGWDDHFRIVPLETRIVHYVHLCLGYTNASGRIVPCDAQTTTEVVWEAGHPTPPMPVPDGWAGVSQCRACYEKEQEAERVHTEVK